VFGSGRLQLVNRHDPVGDQRLMPKHLRLNDEADHLMRAIERTTATGRTTLASVVAQRAEGKCQTGDRFTERERPRG
jgi:hypothetical protein